MQCNVHFPLINTNFSIRIALASLYQVEKRNESLQTTFSRNVEQKVLEKFELLNFFKRNVYVYINNSILCYENLIFLGVEKWQLFSCLNVILFTWFGMNWVELSWVERFLTLNECYSLNRSTKWKRYMICKMCIVDAGLMFHPQSLHHNKVIKITRVRNTKTFDSSNKHWGLVLSFILFSTVSAHKMTCFLKAKSKNQNRPKIKNNNPTFHENMYKVFFPSLLL